MDEISSKSNSGEPNIENSPTEFAQLYEGYYRRAYNTLLAQLNNKIRAKVLQAKTDQAMQRDSDVCQFIEDVIELAEH